MITDKQKKKLEKLINNVYDGFDHYELTLESVCDFYDPMGKLIEYIEKITGTKLKL